MKKDRELPRLGVSACLLGHKVRYDGRDKAFPQITSELGSSFELIAYCPEHGAGLPVPRPPIQLYIGEPCPRLLVVQDKSDVGEVLQTYIMQILKEIKASKICGFILKSKSPSCGLKTTPLYNMDDTPTGEMISGVFAQTLLDELPDLPLIDEIDFLIKGKRKDYIRRCLDYFEGIHAENI
ncbi:MAG TPA: DUF523 domain-containing protein [Candidatus Cloacimonetes bacterium]|nr:DUF523 domain-containing protein [Candidatus Cloacimonadota bacterium]